MVIDVSFVLTSQNEIWTVRINNITGEPDARPPPSQSVYNITLQPSRGKLLATRTLWHRRIRIQLCRDCDDGESLISSSARWRMPSCGVVIGTPDFGRARHTKTITKWNLSHQGQKKL